MSAVIIAGVFSCRCYAAEEEIKLSCTANEYGLSVFISDMNNEDNYEISINGGRSFIPVYDKKGMHFATLPSGTYHICAMKNGDKETITDVYSVKLDYRKRSEDDVRLICEGIRAQEYKSGGLRVTIKNYKAEDEYVVSFDGGYNWRLLKGRTFEEDGLLSGYYDVRIKNVSDSGAGTLQEIYVPHKTLDGSAIVKAPLIKQLPELPTGCEITSLAMALNFYGLNIKHTQLAHSFLDKAEYRTADFRKKFVGNPWEIKAYGCYAGVIENSAEKYLGLVHGRSFDINNITGCDASMLYSYLDMGYPVVVWATTKMMETVQGPTWLDRETGKTVTWVGNEHCLLLTGYDMKRGYVYMNDPQYGIVAYKMSLFEKRFAELEKQAIVIVETTSN